MSAEPTPEPRADRALLADIHLGQVADDEDCRPRLFINGEAPADVGEAVWELERRGWAMQPKDSAWWELTQRGLDVLEGRRGA